MKNIINLYLLCYIQGEEHEKETKLTLDRAVIKEQPYMYQIRGALQKTKAARAWQ